MSRRVATIALPADFEAELRSWGDWEPATDRALRERLYAEHLVETEVARQNLKRFFRNVRDLMLLAVAYAFGPRASATLLVLSLLELIAFSHIGSAVAPSSLNAKTRTSDVLARQFRASARAANLRRSVALSLLYCADAAGQLPLAVSSRAQMVLSYGFALMWDRPWVCLACLAIGIWAAAKFSEPAPPRKSISEHVDAYCASLPRGTEPRSSPRLRIA